MLRPRLLGSLILVYVVLYKLSELTFILRGVRPDDRVDPDSYLVVTGYALILLFALVLLSYTTGSAGLFLKQKWSAVVVFYTAIGEATILLLTGALFMYMATERVVGGLTPLAVLPFLLLLVFPIGFGYAARSLRKTPELWQSPQTKSIDRTEPPDRIEADIIRPGWRQRIFWVVLGTGLLLPVVVAVIVATASLLQEKPFAITGDALFIFALGAVLFALPYVVFAFIVRAVLRRESKEAGYRPVRRLFVLVGIFVGMTVFIALGLSAVFVDGEAAAVLMFAPYWPFMMALPGVVAGAVIGLIAYSVRNFYRRVRDFSQNQQPVSSEDGLGRWITRKTVTVTGGIVAIILFVMMSLWHRDRILELEYDIAKEGLRGPEMVLIEGGRFWMGSDRSGEGAVGRDDDQPRHEVSIGPFYIGKYEVTFDEYDVFVRSTGRTKPRALGWGWGRGRRPVVDVSWDDAVAYAEWLSDQTGERYRLPTEAEWEYAARAGADTLYWWGNNIQQDGKVWANCSNCGSHEWRRRPAPVGSFEPNAFGVHDTAGNVWEWVQDCWHSSYEGAPDDGSAWEASEGRACTRRVFRGGSWVDGSRALRSALRAGNGPDTRAGVLGFRLARDVE